MESQVIVVGGGITGLSAAWELQQYGIPYTVVESADRWGGKVQTERQPLASEGTLVMDAGPESFVTRKPDVWDLAHELQLGDALITPGSETRGVGVLHDGVIHPVPLSPIAFLKSALLSTKGKLRLLAEPFISPRRDTGDETLADFATRRLGREVMERLIGPILGGIYNADPSRQSVLVSAPHMRDLERAHGGLFKGMLASMRKARKQPTGRPRFVAFKDGSETLVSALVGQLTGTLLLNARVQQIAPADGGYTLYLQDGRELRAKIVILATPANVTASIVQNAAPDAAALLAQIAHTSIGTLFLAFRRADLASGSPVRGLMIPRTERRRIDAVLWTSERMPQRAPQGCIMLKVFFGGARPDMMLLDDDVLVEAVRQELEALFSITAKPLFARAFRWHDSYPLAEIGHLERVAQIEAALPPELIVTGSSYRGVGVPDCVHQGRQAAQSAAKVWNRLKNAKDGNAHELVRKA